MVRHDDLDHAAQGFEAARVGPDPVLQTLAPDDVGIGVPRCPQRCDEDLRCPHLPAPPVEDLYRPAGIIDQTASPPPGGPAASPDPASRPRGGRAGRTRRTRFLQSAVPGIPTRAGAGLHPCGLRVGRCPTAGACDPLKQTFQGRLGNLTLEWIVIASARQFVEICEIHLLFEELLCSHVLVSNPVFSDVQHCSNTRPSIFDTTLHKVWLVFKNWSHD